MAYKRMKKIQIDLGVLSREDADNLRAALQSHVPDGVKRLCVAALYRNDPVLSRMHLDIHDVHETEEFFIRACRQMLRDVGISELTGMAWPDGTWHFGCWLTRLLHGNPDLLPDGMLLKRAVLQANKERDEMVGEAACEGCKDETCGRHPKCDGRTLN